jgi:hypothetical protein
MKDIIENGSKRGQKKRKGKDGKVGDYVGRRGNAVGAKEYHVESLSEQQPPSLSSPLPYTNKSHNAPSLEQKSCGRRTAWYLDALILLFPLPSSLCQDRS